MAKNHRMKEYIDPEFHNVPENSRTHNPNYDRVREREIVDETPANTFARPATREEVAYRNGYTEAQLREQNRRLDRARDHDRQVYDDSRTATGIILGILVACALGLIGGAIYWASQANEANLDAVETQPVIPPSDAANDDDPNVIERNTTIIERDRVQPDTSSQTNGQTVVPEASTGTTTNPAAPAPPVASPDVNPTPTQETIPQINLQPNEATPSQTETVPPNSSTNSTGDQ